MNPRSHCLFVFVSFTLAFVASALAQSPGGATGIVTGHVYNTVNKEYVRDAEVHVEGTNITVPTESGGYFSLGRVPAGKVTLTVTYIGLPPTSAEIEVKPGETATHEFELGG